MKKLFISLLLIGTCSPLLGMEQLISPQQSAFNKKVRYAMAGTGIIGGVANLCYQAKNGNLTWKQIGLSAAAIGFGISSLSKKELGMKVTEDDPTVAQKINSVLNVPKTLQPPAVPKNKNIIINNGIEHDKIIAIPKTEWANLYCLANKNIARSYARELIRKNYLQNHEYPLWTLGTSWIKQQYKKLMITIKYGSNGTHMYEQQICSLSEYLQNINAIDQRLNNNTIVPELIKLEAQTNTNEIVEKFRQQESPCLLNDHTKLRLLYEQASDPNTNEDHLFGLFPEEMITEIATYIPESPPSQLQQAGKEFKESIRILSVDEQLKQMFTLIKIRDLVSLLSLINLQDLVNNNFLLEPTKEKSNQENCPYYKTIISDILLAVDFKSGCQKTTIININELEECNNKKDTIYFYCPLSGGYFYLPPHNIDQRSDTDDSIQDTVLCMEIPKDTVRALTSLGITKIQKTH